MSSNTNAQNSSSQSPSRSSTPEFPTSALNTTNLVFEGSSAFTVPVDLNRETTVTHHSPDPVNTLALATSVEADDDDFAVSTTTFSQQPVPSTSQTAQTFDADFPLYTSSTETTPPELRVPFSTKKPMNIQFAVPSPTSSVEVDIFRSVPLTASPNIASLDFPVAPLVLLENYFSLQAVRTRPQLNVPLDTFPTDFPSFLPFYLYSINLQTDFSFTYYADLNPDLLKALDVYLSLYRRSVPSFELDDQTLISALSTAIGLPPGSQTLKDLVEYYRIFPFVPKIASSTNLTEANRVSLYLFSLVLPAIYFAYLLNSVLASYPTYPFAALALRELLTKPTRFDFLAFSYVLGLHAADASLSAASSSVPIPLPSFSFTFPSFNAYLATVSSTAARYFSAAAYKAQYYKTRLIGITIMMFIILLFLTIIFATSSFRLQQSYVHLQQTLPTVTSVRTQSATVTATTTATSVSTKEHTLTSVVISTVFASPTFSLVSTSLSLVPTLLTVTLDPVTITVTPTSPLLLVPTTATSSVLMASPTVDVFFSDFTHFDHFSVLPTTYYIIAGLILLTTTCCCLFVARSRSSK